MKVSAIIAIIVAAVVVIGGALALTRDKDDDKSPSPPPAAQTTPTNTDEQTPKEPTAAEDTITFDGSGFTPTTLTVASGAEITIKNNSQTGIEFNSNDHPTHTKNTDLNVGAVGAGESKTFMVTQKGTFGYHNHLDPSQTGTIVVE